MISTSYYGKRGDILPPCRIATSPCRIAIRLVPVCPLSPQEGNKSGQGTFAWVDASRYVGEFKENDIHGEASNSIKYDKSVSLSLSLYIYTLYIFIEDAYGGSSPHP